MSFTVVPEGTNPSSRPFGTSSWMSLGLKTLTFRGKPLQVPQGFFEVQIVGGALLHSKKNGDGYVNNQAKLDKIIKGIKDAL